MEEIEIILVNDASLDNSYLIMQEYEKEFPEKIKCIYLDQNVSQGGARNRGLMIASGEYVMFVDSDDWIDITMCEKLYRKALEGDYDIVGCDHYRVKEETGEKNWYSLYFRQQMGDLNDRKKASLMFMYATPCMKIIRKCILIENKLFFPEFMKYEDFATVPLFFLYAKSMEMLEEPLYFYLLREHSTSHLADAKHHKDTIKSAEVLSDLMIKRGFNQFEEERKGLYIKQLFNYLKKLVTLSDEKLDLVSLEKMKEIIDVSSYEEYESNFYFYTATEGVGRKTAKLLLNNKEQLIYECEWEIIKENVNYLDYYLYMTSKVTELLDYFYDKQYRVAIWGAGLKGIDFLRTFDKDGKKIICVIDKSEKKHGTQTGTGHTIVGINKMIHELDVVIIMNKNFYTCNKVEIKNLNQKIKTFNLDIFLATRNSQIEQFLE
jgi:glycosyltransferase involved in cell wall biosynthesis